MELLDLKNQIKANQFSPLYIFTGEEYKVMQIYIQQMSTVSHKPLQYYDSYAEYFKSANARRLVLNSHICIIVNDKDTILNEKIIANLTRMSVSDDVLILIHTNIDKRTKFYKTFTSKILEFKPLSEDVLIKYIKKEVRLSDRNCKLLIAVCNSNYGHILLEIDKLKQIQSYYSTKSYDTIFRELIDDGTIYVPPTDAVFKFIDAVFQRDPRKSFSLLAESYASGEATLVLLTNLYNNAKQLLQYQSYKGSDVAKATGLTAFQIKLAKDRVGRYFNGELVYLMKITRRAEVGIKLGEIDENIAVENILVNVL